MAAARRGSSGTIPVGSHCSIYGSAVLVSFSLHRARSSLQWRPHGRSEKIDTTTPWTFDKPKRPNGEKPDRGPPNANPGN